MVNLRISVRLAATSLVMASCALYTGGPGGDDEAPVECAAARPGCPSMDDCFAGDCVDQALYECDPATGQWVEGYGVCEAQVVDVRGDLLLEQSLQAADRGCPTPMPRSSLTFFVQDGGTLTASPPIEILASEVRSGGYGSPGIVRASLADDWAGVLEIVAYDLEVSVGGAIYGSATATMGCPATLWVTGVMCPRGVEPCVTYDDGWNVWCAQGVLRSDDLTRVGYCLPGDTEEVCETGRERHPVHLGTCANGCVNSAVNWFETVDEYNSFVPTSLCAP